MQQITLTAGYIKELAELVKNVPIKDIKFSGVRMETKKRSILEILSTCGFTNCRSDAKRMIVQGAVKVDGARITSQSLVYCVGDEISVQLGKNKQAHLLIVE